MKWEGVSELGSGRSAAAAFLVYFAILPNSIHGVVGQLQAHWPKNGTLRRWTAVPMLWRIAASRATRTVRAT